MISIRIIIFIVVTGSRAYKELVLLITLCFVLRLLNLNFPESYKVTFSPQIALQASTDLGALSNKMICSLELCNKLYKQNPAVITRLELGYSLIDATDKILKLCA